MIRAHDVARGLTTDRRQEWRAVQLLALLPLLQNGHVNDVVRPSIYEVARHIAELLRLAAPRGHDCVLLFSGAGPGSSPADPEYRLWLRLDADEEYDRKEFLGRGAAHAKYARSKHEQQLRYLLVDGAAPEAYEYLVERRAVRIWIGLALVFEALEAQTMALANGIVLPIVESATLAALRAGREELELGLTVEAVHEL